MDRLVSHGGDCDAFVMRQSGMRVPPPVPELIMLRFSKPEIKRERQGRPCGAFVCNHGQVVDNTIMATNPGRGGGG